MMTKAPQFNLNSIAFQKYLEGLAKAQAAVARFTLAVEAAKLKLQKDKANVTTDTDTRRDDATLR
jgi:hypothetical protein